MKKVLTIMAALPLFLAAIIAHAHAVAVPEQVEKSLRQLFSQTRPAMPIASIEPAPVAGLYAVQIANGPMIYTTAAGDYFILGDLYAVQNGRFVNLAEQGREEARAALMSKVKLDDMIIFSPKVPMETKASIMVFTDVDCGYCQKLHKEMASYNRLGIEVRYLAYPRAGIGSESYKKIASAWCAEDRKEAMTLLKNRRPIARNVCADNPVKAQYELGGRVGVTGTPALVTMEGKLMPGYLPALRLAEVLGIEVDAAVAAELSGR